MRSTAVTGQICRRLSSGDGPAVLVADFQALNGAPRLSQLLSQAEVGQRVYQVDPRGALSGDRLYAPLPDLVDEAADVFLAEEPAPVGGQRAFVVGHCTAAGLALRLASRLRATREVTAVLVEPTWPDSDHVIELFAEFQGKVGAGRAVRPELDGEPWSCVAKMEQQMRDDLADLAARLDVGTPPLAFAELLLSYRTWLGFLLACRNDQPAQTIADGVTVSVLTNDPGFVLPGTAPGRCLITPPPPADRHDAVTPELAQAVLGQLVDS